MVYKIPRANCDWCYVGKTGWCFETRKKEHQVPVVQRLDKAIHWINHYPAEMCLQNKPRYSLDSDLSGELRYPPFKQPGPGMSKHVLMNQTL